ncbi:hypothetical protein LBMAG53_32960 [Planctomycetota bacterium]|nr:hypothetical protein LBMAG53_32960 [Planctomycetota bacterium]
MLEVHPAIGLGLGMTPRRNVVAGGGKESTEAKLTACGHGRILGLEVVSIRHAHGVRWKSAWGWPVLLRSQLAEDIGRYGLPGLQQSGSGPEPAGA